MPDHPVRDIYEQVKDKTGAFSLMMTGPPKNGWVEHITFTGPEALIKQLKDVVLDGTLFGKDY